MLADVATEIDAARLLVWRAAWMGRNGVPMTAGQGSMSKLKAGDVAMWATTTLMDLVGPYAQSTDCPLEKFFRDAKIYQIFEGTAQVQRLVVSRMQRPFYKDQRRRRGRRSSSRRPGGPAGRHDLPRARRRSLRRSDPAPPLRRLIEQGGLPAKGTPVTFAGMAGDWTLGALAQARTRLAHYRLLGKLGEGGMEVVYHAEDERLGRQLRAQMLAPGLADNREFRDRFVRESRLAAAIDHPNIIPVYEAGEAEDTLYIAMRYVDGPDLRELLAAEGSLDPRRAVRIVSQAAGALDAAHAVGLVHRDVKPGNVMIDRGSSGEHVYLTDFGLTKNLSASTGFTDTGRFVGTLGYTPPEQIQGSTLDGRADVYALACVLFECLAGTPPFKRDSDIALIYAHMSEPPPSICEVRPDLPVSLANVLERGSRSRPTTARRALSS